MAQKLLVGWKTSCWISARCKRKGYVLCGSVKYVDCWKLPILFWIEFWSVCANPWFLPQLGCQVMLLNLSTLHVYSCLKCYTGFLLRFLFCTSISSLSWPNSWILCACRWQSYHTLHKDMGGWGQQSGWLSFLKVLFRCFTNEILFCLWY